MVTMVEVTTINLTIMEGGVQVKDTQLVTTVEVTTINMTIMDDGVQVRQIVQPFFLWRVFLLRAVQIPSGILIRNVK